MWGLYRALLSLYPAEYCALFAPEMVQVFEEAKMSAKKRGSLALMWFATRECLGLLKGAVIEHTAKWARHDRYIAASCGSQVDVGCQDEVSKVQSRLEHLVRSLEFAIAHHDFQKARLYSNEERLMRARLHSLMKENN